MIAKSKKTEGGYKRLSIAATVVIILMAGAYLINASRIYKENLVYEQEIRMIMEELQGMGSDLIDNGEVGGELDHSDYEFQFFGPRVMHDFLAGNTESSRKMDIELASINERTIEEIKMSELNDPAVIQEVRSSYSKQKKVISETFDRDMLALNKVMEEITNEHKANPEDSFLDGMYSAFANNKPEGVRLSEELMESTNNLFDSVDSYLEFLEQNNGRYNFDEDGIITASAPLLNQYDQKVDEVQDATAKWNEAKQKYMEELTKKMSLLEEAFEEV